MPKKVAQTVICQICGKDKKLDEVISAEIVRDAVSEIIIRTYPNWSKEGYICKSDLNLFRAQYIKEVLAKDKGELTQLENQVIQSLKEQELLAENINIEFEKKRTLGERLADHMALYAGSWKFIGIFFGILIIWIVINSILIIQRPFDPYPFILLNLILSCIAAIQAPIIMMSQNRQEAKDRLRSEHDYRINLKAEMEIRQLHEKVDHLLMTQWQRLLDIQALQIDLMEELRDK